METIPKISNMRDRILKYLREVEGPVSASDVLRRVLGIQSPNGAAAEKLLRGIVGPGTRIHCSNGLWHADSALEDDQYGLADVATLVLQRADRAAFFAARGAAHVPSLQLVSEFLVSPSMVGADQHSLEQARTWLEHRALIVWAPAEVALWNRCLRICRQSEWDGEFLALRELAAAALPAGRVPRHPEELARALDLLPPDAQSPAAMAVYLFAVLKSLAALVPATQAISLHELKNWITERKAEVDFSRFGFGPELLSQAPEAPGVYLMKNRAGEVIYVGKSSNLRRRVRSYFTRRALKDLKIRRIHEQIHTLDFFATASEVEALLEETRLIRDLRPAINLQTEIHERPEGYGKGLNILLLVPNVEGTKAALYFLRRGVFAGRQSVPLGRHPSKRIRARIQSIYFTGASRPIRKRREWEAEIVSRWLSLNRRRVNFIDVDDAGGYENTIQRVADYLLDSGKLSRIIIYR